MFVSLPHFLLSHLIKMQSNPEYFILVIDYADFYIHNYVHCMCEVVRTYCCVNPS